MGVQPEWADANGAGIWISPGSDENQIVGNRFDDIAACAVYLAGDRNVVEARVASDLMCDLGVGNRVRGPNEALLRGPR